MLLPFEALICVVHLMQCQWRHQCNFIYNISPQINVSVAVCIFEQCTLEWNAFAISVPKSMILFLIKGIREQISIKFPSTVHILGVHINRPTLVYARNSNWLSFDFKRWKKWINVNWKASQSIAKRNGTRQYRMEEIKIELAWFRSPCVNSITSFVVCIVFTSLSFPFFSRLINFSIVCPSNSITCSP